MNEHDALVHPAADHPEMCEIIERNAARDPADLTA
jgi:hypothetical protein